MASSSYPIVVAGAGSWGTALAILLARNGHHTVLWGHDPAHLARLAAERANRRHLPGVEFPPSLELEDELEGVLRHARDVILAVPCKALREVSHQVAVYAVAIATEMKLPPERIELIRQAAYLHDIGKLSIPEAILHKPGKLTDIEYDFIKKHTDIGADLLDSVEGLRHLAPFVRHHHERWDGRGYPLGLAGEDIPLEARILNVCDSVETMASDRPYHRGMTLKAIVEEVQRCAGTQFDPSVANTFVKLVLARTDEHFIVNSARSVTQQYAASMLANEGLTNNMFAWVLERAEQK